jgi:K+-transporting ATPase c subunit
VKSHFSEMMLSPARIPGKMVPAACAIQSLLRWKLVGSADLPIASGSGLAPQVAAAAAMARVARIATNRNIGQNGARQIMEQRQDGSVSAFGKVPLVDVLLLNE